MVWESKKRMLDNPPADDEAIESPTWPDFPDDVTPRGDGTRIISGTPGHTHGNVPTIFMSLTEPTGEDFPLKPGDIWVVRESETYYE